MFRKRLRRSAVGLTTAVLIMGSALLGVTPVHAAGTYDFAPVVTEATSASDAATGALQSSFYAAWPKILIVALLIFGGFFVWSIIRRGAKSSR